MTWVCGAKEKKLLHPHYYSHYDCCHCCCQYILLMMTGEMKEVCRKFEEVTEVNQRNF